MSSDLRRVARRRRSGSRGATGWATRSRGRSTTRPSSHTPTGPASLRSGADRFRCSRGPSDPRCFARRIYERLAQRTAATDVRHKGSRRPAEVVRLPPRCPARSAAAVRRAPYGTVAPSARKAARVEALQPPVPAPAVQEHPAYPARPVGLADECPPRRRRPPTCSRTATSARSRPVSSAIVSIRRTAPTDVERLDNEDALRPACHIKGWGIQAQSPLEIFMEAFGK
jgi:hypothetical protein